MTYVVFPSVDLDLVDFSQVLEDSADTVRKSLDGTKTFVKYQGAQPSSVAAITDKDAPRTHAEMVALLDSAFWTKPGR
jgi:hypothetical protein